MWQEFTIDSESCQSDDFLKIQGHLDSIKARYPVLIG